MEQIDYIVRVVDDVKQSQQEIKDLLREQCIKCDGKFKDINNTLHGNGKIGLKTKVYLLMFLVFILFSFHGISLSGISL